MSRLYKVHYTITGHILIDAGTELNASGEAAEILDNMQVIYRKLLLFPDEQVWMDNYEITNIEALLLTCPKCGADLPPNYIERD